jgi:Flp pilus assembly pilin Flp
LPEYDRPSSFHGRGVAVAAGNPVTRPAREITQRAGTGHNHGEGGEILMLIHLRDVLLSLRARCDLHRQEGQALVEYTLILALVSIVAIALLTTIGGDIQKVLEEVVKGLEKA